MLYNVIYHDTMLCYVMRITLFSHEGEGVFLLPQAIEEYREVMVEIEFLDFHFPRQPVHHSSVIDLYGQVPSLVESSGAIKIRL